MRFSRTNKHLVTVIVETGMCIDPGVMWNGSTVICRKCWQCAENKINDWVGRCVAESETAAASYAVTLTYGRNEGNDPDHERAQVLTYSDVQKYIKLLRFNKYPVKYFAVGEYGSGKGRAHWHILLFFKDRVPKHRLSIYGDDRNTFRFMEKHWPHGWSYWVEATPQAARYNCKYIQKDIDKAEAQSLVRMSKKPPLGAQYFTDLAGRYVAQGIAPLEPYYWFADVRGDDDKPVKFYMSGVTLDNFCQSFLDQWAQAYGGHPPTSKMLDKFYDRQRESKKWLNETGAEKRLASLKVERRSEPELYRTGRDGPTGRQRVRSTP